MYPKQHLAMAAMAASLPLITAGVPAAILFVTASTLMDVDHYLRYLVVVRKITRLKTAYRHYMVQDRAERKLRPGEYAPKGLYILHTVEPFVVLALLMNFWPVLFWAMAGGGLHLALDAYDCRRRGINYTKYISICGYLVKDARFKSPPLHRDSHP